MRLEGLSIRVMMVLVLLSLATVAWALDADDQDSADGSKPDTTSETEDAAAGPATFNPPHDDHVNSTPEHPTHQSGASAAGGADLEHAATDPSAILTQFQNYFWTTGSSDDKNISNTYLLQPVLPLTKTNVFRPALPVVNTSGETGIGDLFLLDVFLNQVKTGT